jgi:DNA-3-methyladenine glycosylase
MPSDVHGTATLTLPRAFYARPTLEVAPDLLGKVLVHDTRAGRASGIIVEVEAYVGESDPACHAAPGPTRRNEPLYGDPGHAYVYLNYGIHHLVNAVTEPKGSPAAVLIRALQPIEGLELMRRRRRAGGARAGLGPADLCRGPGNLTCALGISLAQNRADLAGSRLTIEDRGIAPASICWTRRIGITVGVEREWRCHVSDSEAVSGRVLRRRPLSRLA